MQVAGSFRRHPLSVPEAAQPTRRREDLVHLACWLADCDGRSSLY
ncbi:hypothetical protein ACGFIE_16405 [Micromonospora sp. NPDC049275]